MRRIIVERLRRLFTLLPIVFVGLVFCTSIVSGQVPDPVTAASAPIPGVGHNYIGMGAETVNPADGSVSFDLPLIPPTGRGLSFPFGIRYSSQEPFYLGTTTGYLLWGSSPAPPFELNGWSYELPSYTGAAVIISTKTVTNPNGTFTLNCDGTHNYIFRAFDGMQHHLGLSNNWLDPNNAYPYSCPPSDTGGGLSGNGVLSTLSSNPSPGVQPSLTATDRSGTVYQFPQGPYLTVNSGSSTPWGMLAQTVTDRNGNQITLSGSNNGTSFQAGHYVDTLGRNVVSWSGIGGSTGDVLTISGLSANLVVKWTTITVHFPVVSNWVSGSPTGYDWCGFSGQAQSAQIKAVSEIDLPNGQKYTFSYGGTYGGLIRITFPEGGYVRYVWGPNHLSNATYQTFTNPNVSGSVYCWAEYDTGAITDRYVSYDGSTEVQHQQFAYSTNWTFNSTANAPQWTSKNTTVTASDLLTGQTTVTNYTYTSIPETGYANDSSWLGNQTPLEQTVLYQDGGKNTLKTVNKTWRDQFNMIGDQTILDNGQGMTTLRCYDSVDKTRPINVYEYDFQSNGPKPPDPSCPEYTPGQSSLSAGLNASAMGPLLRQTATAYHNYASGVNILDDPDSITLYDGSANTVKQATYAYTDAVQSSNTAVGLVAPPEANRGNISSISRWVGGSSWITTNYTYFDTGQLQSMTDPCGSTSCADVTGTNHTTTYSYTDNFASGTGSAPGQTNAYLTQVTYPSTGVAHVKTLSWGYKDGLLRSSTDENSQTTNFQYNDPLLRLTQINYPDLGQKSVTYNDATYSGTNNTPNFTVTNLISTSPSTLNVVTATAFDGMGHTVRTLLTSDPSGTDTTDTGFDGFARVRTRANPHRSTSSSTDGTTTTSYDAMGRVVSVLEPDGSTATTSYSGQCTTVTDEAGKSRKSCTDALGRLAQVFEDPTGLNYETDYRYDTLGNLTRADQKGSAPTDSSQWRTRTFTYDALSRLLTANNPESGTVTYTYDANGNVNTKQDARNITITYGYDVLNRLTSKSYSNGDGSISYTYDAFVNNTTCSGSGNFGIGRRTGMTDSSGSTTWTYDTMGSVWNERRVIGSVNKTISNCYNLDGSLSQTTYPSGSVFAYSYDTAQHLLQVKDTAHNITYFQNTSYYPGGQINQATYGNAVETSIFNGRLQPCWYYAATATPLAPNTACGGTATAANVLDLKYNFGYGTNDNGNVLNLTNDKDSNRSVAYAYDALNRIASATTPNADCSTMPSGITKNWGETFTVDAWGNLTNRSATKCSAEPLSVVALTNNRLSGFGYDADGNMTSNGGASYTYTAERRLKTAGGVTYTYDGDGNRVKKSNGTLYWGNGPLLESDLSGNLQREFIFAQGRRIARRDISSGAVYYYFSDHLSSADVVTDSNGAIQNESDYFPYGGERVYSQSLANQNYKFTGKERDSESGLDNFGARYDSTALGRFMTPDWAAKPTTVPYAAFGDPQTLNLYTYVENAPINQVDGDGHGDSCVHQPSQPGTTSTGPDPCQNEKQNSAFLQYVKGEAAGLVEYGKQMFNMLGAIPYVGPFFGAGSAAVSASQGETGQATTSAALAALPLGGDLSAGGRALELAGTMGKTADYVTIAVTETKEGVNVISSSENALRPAVRAALQEGEVAAKGAGHAEVTGVNAAKQMGLTPTGVAASRGICPSCAQFLRDVGVAALSALRGVPF